VGTYVLPGGVPITHPDAVLAVQMLSELQNQMSTLQRSVDVWTHQVKLRSTANSTLSALVQGLRMHVDMQLSGLPAVHGTAQPGCVLFTVHALAFADPKVDSGAREAHSRALRNLRRDHPESWGASRFSVYEEGSLLEGVPEAGSARGASRVNALAILPPCLMADLESPENFEVQVTLDSGLPKGAKIIWRVKGTMGFAAVKPGSEGKTSVRCLLPGVARHWPGGYDLLCLQVQSASGITLGQPAFALLTPSVQEALELESLNDLAVWQPQSVNNFVLHVGFVLSSCQEGRFLARSLAAEKVVRIAQELTSITQRLGWHALHGALVEQVEASFGHGALRGSVGACAQTARPAALTTENGARGVRSQVLSLLRLADGLGLSLMDVALRCDGNHVQLEYLNKTTHAFLEDVTKQGLLVRLVCSVNPLTGKIWDSALLHVVQYGLGRPDSSGRYSWGSRRLEYLVDGRAIFFMLLLGPLTLFRVWLDVRHLQADLLPAMIMKLMAADVSITVAAVGVKYRLAPRVHDRVVEVLNWLLITAYQVVNRFGMFALLALASGGQVARDEHVDIMHRRCIIEIPLCLIWAMTTPVRHPLGFLLVMWLPQALLMYALFTELYIKTFGSHRAVATYFGLWGLCFLLAACVRNHFDLRKLIWTATRNTSRSCYPGELQRKKVH